MRLGSKLSFATGQSWSLGKVFMPQQYSSLKSGVFPKFFLALKFYMFIKTLRISKNVHYEGHTNGK
jgi:hypothetical protein